MDDSNPDTCRIDSELLHAYLDCELSKAEAGQVAAFLAENSDVSALAGEYRCIDAALKRLLAPMLRELIPERLLITIGDMPPRIDTDAASGPMLGLDGPFADEAQGSGA